MCFVCILDPKRAATAQLSYDGVDCRRVIVSSKPVDFEDNFHPLDERRMDIAKECRDPAGLVKDKRVLVFSRDANSMWHAT